MIATVETWTAVGWILYALVVGWTAHAILPEWWRKRGARRGRKERCATLDAYWSHEITAQEAARRLGKTRR